MRGNDFLEKMGLIDPAYVEAADTATKKKENFLDAVGSDCCLFCSHCCCSNDALPTR